MALEDQERLREIFIKYLDNQCTPAEMAELMEYFREVKDSEHLRQLVTEYMSQPVDRAFEDSPQGKEMFNNAYLDIRSRIDIGKPSKTTVRHIVWKRISIAASIVLLMGLSWVFRDNLVDWINPVEIQYLTTQTGERQQITLLDGTEVWLSPESTLEYPDKFRSGNREVILTGEAFFDVAPNPDQPFVISSGQVSTTVLGTSFNIEAYDNENISVTVVTGAVSVEMDSKSDQVRLSPNERAVFNQSAKSLSKEPAPNADDLLAQREGIFRYRETPMTTVIKDLQRYYGVNIRINGKSDQSVFGTLDTNEGITVFLEKLSITIGAEWQKVGEGEYFIRTE